MKKLQTHLQPYLPTCLVSSACTIDSVGLLSSFAMIAVVLFCCVVVDILFYCGIAREELKVIKHKEQLMLSSNYYYMLRIFGK